MPDTGTTLTLSTPGSWTGADSVSGQWTRDGADIAGATGATLAAPLTDTPGSYAYRETASNAQGTASVLSNAVALTAPGGASLVDFTAIATDQNPFSATITPIAGGHRIAKADAAAYSIGYDCLSAGLQAGAAYRLEFDIAPSAAQAVTLTTASNGNLTAEVADTDVVAQTISAPTRVTATFTAGPLTRWIGVESANGIAGGAHLDISNGVLTAL